MQRVRSNLEEPPSAGRGSRAAQLKDMRADLKRTAEKLAKAHPDSESIKHSFRLTFSV